MKSVDTEEKKTVKMQTLKKVGFPAFALIARELFSLAVFHR